MEILAFDIETIPSQSLPEACIPQFDPEDVKMGNLKDHSKIAAKLEQEKASFAESLSKKMSLDPALAQLCTFCGIRYNAHTDKIVSEVSYQVTAEDDHDDYSAVYEGWSMIVSAYHERIPIVTFNGKSFDLPVMMFRAIQQDVPVDIKAYDALTYRYQNQHHYDLLQLLAGWERTRWHKLDFYLKLFGLKDKNDMDGSMVYTFYQAKEYDKIKEYCRNDVLSTCELFSRTYNWLVRNEPEQKASVDVKF